MPENGKRAFPVRRTSVTDRDAARAQREWLTRPGWAYVDLNHGPLPYQLHPRSALPVRLEVRESAELGCWQMESGSAVVSWCCQPWYYGTSVTSPGRSGRTRSNSNLALVSALALPALALVTGVVISVLTASSPSGFGGPIPPFATPTESRTPTPTPSVTSTPAAAHAPPTPIEVVLPSSIAITVNGGSGGLPPWAGWLGPIGGFLTGIGALGGLVAFRHRKEQQREEEQTTSGPSSR
jgi:hypothetical protein